MDDKLLGLDPADFGTTGLTLHTLIGVAYADPERVLPRGMVYGCGGGPETMQVWRLRAIYKLLEMHDVPLGRMMTRGADPDAEYLIWSNDAQVWWKPVGSGYTVFISDAGRYDRADAEIRAGSRTWDPAQPLPPEVIVQAPSAELLASPDLRTVMADRVGIANTRAVIGRREATQCRTCGSTSPAEYLTVGGGFRCDDPGGWHKARLVAQ